jgi:glycosyltransferase involved in cell wall biosynthesis
VQEVPIISVLIPTYNRRQTVIKAVHSVVTQTKQPFEIIVADDCSSDGTCAADFAGWPLVKFVRALKNAGPAAARNLAASIAQGSWLAFLDSDDTWEPTFVEEVSGHLSEQSSNIGFCWTGVQVYYKQSNQPPAYYCWHTNYTSNSYLQFLHNLRIGTGLGVCVNKAYFDKIKGFDNRLRAAEDTDFFLRLIQVCGFTFVDKPLVNITRDIADTQRVTFKYDEMLITYEILLEKHTAIHSQKTLQKKYYYKLQWLNYYAKKKANARRYFFALIKAKIFEPKSWIIGFVFELFGYSTAIKIHQKLGKRS